MSSERESAKDADFLLKSYIYTLKPDRIALRPAETRSESRLLAMDKTSGDLSVCSFKDIGDFLRPGDLIIANDTKVVPCRLELIKKETGGRVELFVLDPNQAVEQQEQGRFLLTVKCLLKTSRKLKPPTLLKTRLPGLKPPVELQVVSVSQNQQIFELLLHSPISLMELLEDYGEMPLPPYIVRSRKEAALPIRSAEDIERYQTVYSRAPGAVAAPTAGLHFDDEIIKNLKKQGVSLKLLTLHVGAGTFKPISEPNILDHNLHSEVYELRVELVEEVRRTKRDGGRILAVGTTSLRALEANAQKFPKLQDGVFSTSLYVYPGFSFRVVDMLLTNFHLPGSSLLVLVSAFSERQKIMAAYDFAQQQGFRFYSYGDCMLLGNF